MPKNKVIMTAHQPVYLPWLGLFHKISLADMFVYFDDVQYQTKDWNNRNKIRTNQGDIWLTVPVLSKNHYTTKLKDIVINNNLPWVRKHFKSIYIAYKKAKYFDRYIGFFEDVYSRKWDKLTDLNEYMLKYFLKLLGIEIPFYKLSDYGFASSKSDLVLEMCQKMEAKLYIFGIQGKNYADVESFNKAGVKVYFQDYKHPVYDQLHGKEFSPFLSIVDLLFNYGEESLNIIRSGNITKDDLLGSLI
jgi:hypothetical protein